MIPSPEIVASSVIRERNQLKNLDSGFKLGILYIFLLVYLNGNNAAEGRTILSMLPVTL